MEATTRPFYDQSVTLTLSLSDEEFFIEHNPSSSWVDGQLNAIAQQLLFELNAGNPVDNVMVKAFVNQVLNGLPEDGGAIPLDNIDGFFSVNYPQFHYQFINFSSPLFVFESKQRYVA
jgi:hypothetical protein